MVKEKSKGRGGVVVETEAPRNEVISIRELCEKAGHFPGGLTEEQIEEEDDHVYFGGMEGPDDEYKPLVVKKIYQILPDR